MEERRRAPRVSFEAPISDVQSSHVSHGTIINISEYGIRYSKPNDQQVAVKKSGPIKIRTIYFSLPENENYLRLVCHVITEQINNRQVETSCEFLGLSNDVKQHLHEYVHKSL